MRVTGNHKHTPLCIHIDPRRCHDLRMLRDQRQLHAIGGLQLRRYGRPIIIAWYGPHRTLSIRRPHRLIGTAEKRQPEPSTSATGYEGQGSTAVHEKPLVSKRDSRTSFSLGRPFSYVNPPHPRIHRSALYLRVLTRASNHTHGVLTYGYDALHTR